MENENKNTKNEQDDIGENFEEKMDEGKEDRYIPEQDKKKSCFKADNIPPKTRAVKIIEAPEVKELDEQISSEVKERRKKRAQFKTVKEPKELKNNAFEIKDNKFVRKSKRSTTLVEKAKLSDKLLEAEMSLMVKQDILVIEEKGNPSKKYKPKRMLGREIRNEIDILKKLSHPNIVKIYEFYVSENHYYIITEYCKEGELFSYIKNKYSERQLAVLFYQVFSGLWYLHENKILHRDIKLENIMISEKEKDNSTGEELFWVKIIDFGTAKLFEKNKKEKDVVGSSYYIAPEVLKQNYNEKCDTWSVGVILYMTHGVSGSSST